MVVSVEVFRDHPPAGGERPRAFTDHDDGKFPVAIINQTMQRHRWPNEDPVGRRVSFGPGQNNSPQVWLTIVGVVGDAKEYGLDRENARRVVYSAAPGRIGGNVILRNVGRADERADGLCAPALKDVDSQLAVDRVNTIEGFQQDLGGGAAGDGNATGTVRRARDGDQRKRHRGR
jgi:hypothetical protein